MWSTRNGKPFRQMEARGVNMQNVRIVKSIRWKSEKRVFERIDHVIRMEINRMVNGMVLQGCEGVKGKEKNMGCKTRPVLYWKKTLNECGMD